MSVETLKAISVTAYAVSGIFLLITIWLFFRLNIKGIFGEITGITKRKAIRDIRNQSHEEKPSFYSPPYAKGKNTGKTGRGTSRKLNGLSGKIHGETGNVEKNTSVLVDDEYGQTAVLESKGSEENVRLPGTVKVVYEIVMCDTDEVIV